MVLTACRGRQALAMTNSEFQKLFSSTAAGFLKLFSNLGANAGNLAGPVGVMQMGTEASKQVVHAGSSSGQCRRGPLPAEYSGGLMLHVCARACFDL